jgi:hypothetical protein
MHPIERLRYVARASGADQRVLVHETATALRGLRLEPSGLVTACRRIVERHPTSGPLWWLCAEVLTASDPFEQALRCADLLDIDPTADELVDALPEDATVAVLGWPDLVGEAVIRRGDVVVLAIDVLDEGAGLVRRLQRADVEAESVPPAGLGAAAASADLVLLEASACGPDGALTISGGRAAAAVAYCAEVPVWLVAGRGRRLPDPMWQTLLDRLGELGDPWLAEDEVVPIQLVSHVVGPDGVQRAPGDVGVPECPLAHELLRSVGF